MDELWRRILVFFELKEPEPDLCGEEVQLIALAKEEWIQAQVYFEFVNDPELIEYAIFAIKAAELKYRYLLKRARVHGLCIYPVTGEVAIRSIAGDLSFLGQKE